MDWVSCVLPFVCPFAEGNWQGAIELFHLSSQNLSLLLQAVSYQQTSTSFKILLKSWVQSCCIWYADGMLLFCSNKQKKQLSPFWSKISETIGGTIWNTSSVRYWAMWIAEFYKELNASIDWISGVWGFFFFSLVFGVICVWPGGGMAGREEREKCPEVPSLLFSFLCYSETPKTWQQALPSSLAVLCRTPRPHRLSLLQNNCRWFPLPMKNQLTHKDFWFLFSDCKHAINSATQKNVCISYIVWSQVWLLFFLHLQLISRQKQSYTLFFFFMTVADWFWQYDFFVSIEETA